MTEGRENLRDFLVKLEAHRKLNRELFLVFIVATLGAGLILAILDMSYYLIVVMIVIFIPLAVLERVYSKRIYGAK